MNKHIFYIAAACVALASCVKNEVRVNAPDQEITFQTVSTKEGEAFKTNKHFFSYAYFLKEGDNWNDKHAEAKAYIDNALITYNTPDAGEGYWAAKDKYYWPKKGSLTFFAWTDNTIHDPVKNPAPSVGTGATVSCAHDTGIKITNYSVKENKNKDILVADIANNKKSNESATGSWEKGVPTVFRHALAKVEFKVNKKEDYPKVTFKVKSITLNNVSTKGTFTQGSPTESWGWSGQDTPDNLTVFSSATGVEVTKTAVPGSAEFDALDSGDYSIVLPQTFNNDTPTLTIVYDIITSYVDAEHSVTEEVTETKHLKDIYKSESSTSTAQWECKKKYVLGITLSLNEIYWDPSVVEWANGDVTDIQF